MSELFKRGKFWSYDFQFRGVRYQGSTRIKNHEQAKIWINAFRTNLALTSVGMVQKEPPPILSVFLNGVFLDSVRQNAKKPRTLEFYVERVRVLCSYPPFTQLRLDRIDELAVQGYKDSRLAKKLAIATINAELRTLRKAMIFADTCGLIRYRRIRALPGETHRTFVLDGETETRYLALADYPLKQVAILMLDLGLRPDEAVSLRHADVSAAAVVVREGKTANARRSLPQTERTREVFDLCFALFPSSEWIFPGSKGQHFTRGAISNLHTKLRDGKYLAGTRNVRIRNNSKTAASLVPTSGMATDAKFPKDFVLYSCRHTYGTRLAESGASPFEIGYLMGHSSVKVSERYIHFGPYRSFISARSMGASPS